MNRRKKTVRKSPRRLRSKGKTVTSPRTSRRSRKIQPYKKLVVTSPRSSRRKRIPLRKPVRIGSSAGVRPYKKLVVTSPRSSRRKRIPLRKPVRIGSSAGVRPYKKLVVTSPRRKRMSSSFRRPVVEIEPMRSIKTNRSAYYSVGNVPDSVRIPGTRLRTRKLPKSYGRPVRNRFFSQNGIY